VTYPVAKTATRQPQTAGVEPRIERPQVATIDVNASRGRAGLAIGSRVRITGSGLYSGEPAVIERLMSSVIPSALVRTESGKTRQVRTIDLEPIAPATPAAAATQAPQPAAQAPAPTTE
jgi:hypothetical protein